MYPDDVPVSYSVSPHAGHFLSGVIFLQRKQYIPVLPEKKRSFSLREQTRRTVLSNSTVDKFFHFGSNTKVPYIIYNSDSFLSCFI